MYQFPSADAEEISEMNEFILRLNRWAERNQLAKSELVAELITFYHINMLSNFQDNFGEAVIPDILMRQKEQ